MFDNQIETSLTKKLESRLITGLACLASISFPFIAGCRSAEESYDKSSDLPKIEARFENSVVVSANEVDGVTAPKTTPLGPESQSRSIPVIKALLVYDGKELQFTSAQSPELFSHCQRLAAQGISIVILKDEGNLLSVSLCDRTTDYPCSRTFQITRENLYKFTREKGPLPDDLSEFLNSAETKGSLLVGQGEQVSSAFYQMALEGAANIPDEAATFLLREGWTVIPKHSLTPHAITTEKGRENRMPSGRCIPSEKRIELGEYYGVNASVKNASVASLYHEIGHALYFTHIEKDPTLKQSLAIALEHDLNQLGDLTLYKDAEDLELSLKLSYYSNVSEGFAESYKNMLCPSLGKGRIMLTYFPTFYSTSQNIINRVLTSQELVARAENATTDRG